MWPTKDSPLVVRLLVSKVTYKDECVYVNIDPVAADKAKLGEPNRGAQRNTTPPSPGSSLGRPFTPIMLREEKESKKDMKLVNKAIQITNKEIDGGYVLVSPPK